MSGAHLHLLVNHAPILGSFFALALLAASFLYAPDVLRKTALVVLIGTAIAALTADLTGDPAADAIRGFPGVQRALIHDHEEIAETALIFAGVVGALALAALWRWRGTTIPRGAAYLALIVTLALSGVMAYTGLLGGRIRHTEVRPGASPADAAVVEVRNGSR